MVKPLLSLPYLILFNKECFTEACHDACHFCNSYEILNVWLELALPFIHRMTFST